MEDRNGNYMYVDVVEVVPKSTCFHKGELVCSRSYNIGTVRILNNAVKETEWERLKKDMQELAISYPGTNIIGSGGNINKLYRLAEKKDKKKQRITVEVLHKLHEKPEQKAICRRTNGKIPAQTRPGWRNRSGWQYIPDHCRHYSFATHIYVPVIGLADGIIDGLYASHLEEKQKILGILPSKKMLRTHLKIRKNNSYFSNIKTALWVNFS